MPHGYYEILVRLSESPSRAMRMSELASRHAVVAEPALACGRAAGGAWLGRAARLSLRPPRPGRAISLTRASVLEAAAPGHVEAVRENMIDQLTPEQINALEEIGQALLDHLAPEACAPD